MREEYTIAGTLGCRKEAGQLQITPMSLKQSARHAGMGTACIGSHSGIESSPTVSSTSTPRTILTQSPLPTSDYPSVAAEHHLQTLPPKHHHGHSHHHIRYNIHKHMHQGLHADTLSSRDTSPEISYSAIVSEVPIPGAQAPKVAESVSESSPPNDGRGRSRIVRRMGRSSSSESNCSSNIGEQDATLINRVEELIQHYRVTGDCKELARIARDEGIPAQLRRIVWPILLQSHPYVKEKSLAKEYRHSSDSYTPRHIPINRIRNELGRYHRRKTHTPSTRNSSPPSSTSPATSVNGPASTATLPTDSASIGALDQGALDLAVESAIIFFLEKHDGITYSRGMVYVCFALAEWIYLAPSQLAALNAQGHMEDSGTQANLLSTCFEQMMCIMLWAPPMQAPTGRMEGVTEQKISTFLTECRQLVPELCVILDDEEALGFEEEWVQSWVQWWCAKEIGKSQRGRLWDWHLGYQKPEQKPGAAGLVPDEGFDEAFGPSDWHILVCVALLKCLHDHVDDLEQSEIRSLLSNIPDRAIGSMSKIIEVAKSFRTQLKEIKEQEDEEYALSSGRDIKTSATAPRY